MLDRTGVGVTLPCEVMVLVTLLFTTGTLTRLPCRKKGVIRSFKQLKKYLLEPQKDNDSK